MGSPLEILSPSLLSHCVIFPSVIVDDRAGMNTSFTARATAGRLTAPWGLARPTEGARPAVDASACGTDRRWPVGDDATTFSPCAAQTGERRGVGRNRRIMAGPCPRARGSGDGRYMIGRCGANERKAPVARSGEGAARSLRSGAAQEPDGRERPPRPGLHLHSGTLAEGIKGASRGGAGGDSKAWALHLCPAVSGRKARAAAAECGAGHPRNIFVTGRGTRRTGQT